MFIWCLDTVNLKASMQVWLYFHMFIIIILYTLPEWSLAGNHCFSRNKIVCRYNQIPLELAFSELVSYELSIHTIKNTCIKCVISEAENPVRDGSQHQMFYIKVQNPPTVGRCWIISLLRRSHPKPWYLRDCLKPKSMKFYFHSRTPL